MKRLAILAIALSTAFSSVGCCGWPWPWPCQNGYYGPGFQSQGYGGGCPTGNCGVQQPMPGQTGFYQSYDSIQAAQVNGPAPNPQFAATPDPISGGAVHRTAMVPLESFPTYP